VIVVKAHVLCFQLLDKGVSVDGGVTVAKMVHTLPSKWADCVTQGRIKFEKYFNHKVCNLIYCSVILSNIDHN